MSLFRPEGSAYSGPLFGMVAEARPDFGRAEDPVAVIEIFRADAQADREWFQALYLDVKNNIIQRALEFVGGAASSEAHPREIVRRALFLGASSVIVVHNHPSGDPEPSRADQELTRSLSRALGYMAIKLLDHIIIGAKINGYQRHYSFQEAGFIAGLALLDTSS